MYAHKVIDDLKTKSQIVVPEALDWVIAKIEQSQKFHVGDWRGFQNFLSDQVYEEMVWSQMSDVMRLPYNITYIDGEIGMGEFSEEYITFDKKLLTDVKFAMLFITSEDANLIKVFTFHSQAMNQNTVKKQWCLSPSVTAFSINMPLSAQSSENLNSISMGYATPEQLSGDYMDLLLDPDFSDSSLTTYDHYYNVLLPWLQKTSGANMNDILRTMLVFCSFLDCKNIGTIDILPPEKLNKKRVKKGNCPFFIYKTLVIKSIGKKQAQNEAQGLWENRVHLCRGHFKTYTKDAPLFGKYIGRYWWQPSVKGNKKKGVVIKDYKLDNENIGMLKNKS